jgi:hypothetical protein
VTTYDQRVSEHLDRIAEQLRTAGPVALSNAVRVALERVKVTVVASPPVWPDYVQDYFSTRCATARRYLDGQGTCPDEATRFADAMAVLDRFELEDDQLGTDRQLQDLMDAVNNVCSADDPASVAAFRRIYSSLITVAESSEDLDGPEDYASLVDAEMQVQRDLVERILGGTDQVALEAEFGHINVGRSLRPE